MVRMIAPASESADGSPRLTDLRARVRGLETRLRAWVLFDRGLALAVELGALGLLTLLAARTTDAKAPLVLAGLAAAVFLARAIAGLRTRWPSGPKTALLLDRTARANAEIPTALATTLPATDARVKLTLERALRHASAEEVARTLDEARPSTATLLGRSAVALGIAAGMTALWLTPVPLSAEERAALALQEFEATVEEAALRFQHATDEVAGTGSPRAPMDADRAADALEELRRTGGALEALARSAAAGVDGDPAGEGGAGAEGGGGSAWQEELSRQLENLRNSPLASDELRALERGLERTSPDDLAASVAELAEAVREHHDRLQLPVAQLEMTVRAARARLDEEHPEVAVNGDGAPALPGHPSASLDPSATMESAVGTPPGASESSSSRRASPAPTTGAAFLRRHHTPPAELIALTDRYFEALERLHASR